MIEIRKLYTSRKIHDPLEGPYIKYTMPMIVLQYRYSINDDDVLKLETLWSGWIDVPDVIDDQLMASDDQPNQT